MAAIFNSPGRVLSCIGLARSISSTSVSFTGKGIRSAVEGFRIREEELQDMDPDDLERITESSLDTLSLEAQNIHGDAKRYQDHLRKKTIEQKYFKPRGPVEVNLLTWSMKEQLKYLHSSDPNQWTPEVLAEAFPISPEGVVRLLQSHWAPKSEAERRRHDRAVATRWKIHMKGQIGSFKILEKALNDNKFFPENLPAPVPGMNHILSQLDSLEFDGEKPHEPKELKTRNRLPKQPKMKGKSFSSIIEDYRKQTEVKNQSEESTNTTDLTAVSGTPQYEGSYSKVTGGGSKVTGVRGGGRKMSRHSNRKSELMTLADFKKRKSVGS